MQNAERDISILVQSKPIISTFLIYSLTVGFVLTSALETWSTLGITPYILYGMVNAMLSVKSGQGQPLVNPGEGRWLIVQLPYGQALSPTSQVAVPAGEYEISLRQQGELVLAALWAVLTCSNRLGLLPAAGDPAAQLGQGGQDQTRS